ncbi:MAG: ATPase [Desulfuromonadales bacterium]|nr:ATPase [Desulfuromonadales bacterium]
MMSKPFGEKMLEENRVSKEQVREALTRQRLNGGRLGQNLVALGYISEDQLDSFFKREPPAPKTVADTGLSLDFIADLALKHLVSMGEFRLNDLAQRLGLPVAILDEAIELLRSQKLVEVRSATQFIKSSFNFITTELGKQRAGELMEVCRYLGPAPVTLDAYRQMVENQSIRNIMVDDDAIRAAFSEIVITDSLLKRLGPAVSSGAPIFIYGPPGNGKTTIAETIGEVLPETVFIPYAIFVGGQIVSVFDPVNHLPTAAHDGRYNEAIDQRWIEIRRPVVITGGELTLRMLDLEFNTIAKYYEAPLQMKSNNGLFIIDDFGRQQMNPQQLLNRWIINLDRQIDFMSMHTGMKFEIPFDQLVIFATNLDPTALVDEAFLRRIRYKIKIDHPTEGAYREIFRRVCVINSIPFDTEVLDYLLERWYRHHDMPLNACHPRDLVNHLIDMARYCNRPVEMSRETIDQACENYFVTL